MATFNVIKAIQKINPDAEVSVSGDDINTIVWENGTTPISKSKVQAELDKLNQEEQDEKTALENNKASGKSKLEELGLTADEIKALTGV